MTNTEKDCSTHSLPARKYAMTRVKTGDYLLPSNDAKTLWRIRTYEEDGLAETMDGRKLTGVFWGLWRRPFPRPGALFDLEAWDEWELWAAPLEKRQDAIDEAMRCEDIPR
jgi:hypothetical protein